MRVDQRLFDQIKQSASDHGRSYTREIEARLIEAYAGENLYGGPRIAAVLRRLAATAAAIEARYRCPPLGDRLTFNSLKRAWFREIEDEAPPGYER